MASNYNINDMVNYLNQYNQQQNIPQYQVTPEQMQAYANIINLQNQQQDLRQYDVRKLQEAQLQDQKINAINNLATQLRGIDTRPPAASFNLYNWRGNTTDTINVDGRQPFSDNIQQVENPQRTDINTQLAKAQIDLREQARQQQLKNAQDMAKFQEAIAVANQYGIPIGQAMGLTGKDVLDYNKNIASGQAGVQKEIVSSIGDLYKQNLTNEGNLQLQELKNTGDYNTTQLKAINDLLIAKNKAENDLAITKLKEQGLNDRQINDLISRKEIANINAKARTDAAVTRAEATRYAADQRAQSQPSYGPLSAGLNNFMFLPPDQQAKVMADYDAYTRAIGLRGDNAPQVNPQNVNTMNNFIKPQGDAYFQ